MGGKAAKERRRLARLATNDGADTGKKETPNEKKTESKSPCNKPYRHAKEKNRFPHQSRQQSRRPEGDFGRRAPNLRFAPHDDARQRPTKKQEKKKLKVKKPKHLKRKIEKLSEDDEAIRQKLIDELKQFEARKSALGSSKPAPKRQKQNVPAREVSKTDVRDSGTVEKQVTQEQAASLLVTNSDAKEPASTPPTMTGATPVANSKVTSPIPQMADDSDDSDDSDSDVSLEEATRRQRGRRRRGRKSTEELSKSISDVQNEPPTKSKSPSKIQILTDPPKDSIDKSCPSKKTSKTDDKRRCIGRKPVTDFVVGQRYPGKIVYTKHFGVFIDIGCHSDAFCHVSRVRDDYVESISEALSIGQEVKARVVEIDRRAKKITVSLQSDARIEDELASIEARKLRKEKHSKGKRPSSEAGSHVGSSSSQPTARPAASEEQAVAPTPAPPIDESLMTPAELKRARKLARRAVRREQEAQTGLAA